MNNFFPHDSNARNSDRLIRLRAKHGAAGYGVYFMLIERLRDETDYVSARDYEMLAFDLRVDTELIRSVVEDYGLFELTDDGRGFYSDSFLRRMKIKDDKVEQAKRGAAAKWGNIDDRSKSTRSERLSAARKLDTHTTAEWQEMRDMIGHCVICGTSAEDAKLVKDHIIPIYQGGSDGISNIQPLCRACSSRKGSDTSDYRIRYCASHNIEMPAKWLPDSSATPAECLPNACRTSAERLPNACEMPASKVKESKVEDIISSTTTTARAQDVSTDESSLFSSPRPKEKSCAKKESDFCGLPPDNPAYIPIDRVADYLRGEQAWLESLCMNRHLRLDYVLSKIDEFGVELSLKGETVKDCRDCKSHFNNWLRKTSNRYERPPITQSDPRVDSDNLLRNCQERVAQRMARAEAREMGQHGVGVPDALQP